MNSTQPVMRNSFVMFMKPYKKKEVELTFACYHNGLLHYGKFGEGYGARNENHVVCL